MGSPDVASLGIRQVRQASVVLSPVVHHTPVVTSTSLSRTVGNRVLFKMENQQKTGSFKIRGAFFKIASLSPEERARGVVAASAGNHAQGVAYAARHYGIPATVVMPEGTPRAKVEATRGYGARVVLTGKGYEEAYQEALRIQAEEGATFVHAFDDPYVVAGQGTVGLELLQDVSQLDAVLVPVGGGGLAAGVALAVKATAPHVRVVGVQSEVAPAAERSWRSGSLTEHAAGRTVAEGIAVARPGEIPWQILRQHLDDLVTVSEAAIARAMLELFQRAKVVVEGAGAAGLAALIEDRLPLRDAVVAVVLSGGNVDPDRFPGLPGLI